MLIPNFDYFTANIEDADNCMLVIDYYKNQNAIEEVKQWKSKLLNKIKEVNNDDYYDYEFFGRVDVKEKINLKASKYFTDDPEEFKKFTEITLLLNEKIKPLNNKSLKDQSGVSSYDDVVDINIGDDLIEIDLIIQLLKNFKVEEKSEFDERFISQFKGYLLKNKYKDFSNQILETIFSRDQFLIPILFSTILENLNKLKNEFIKSQKFSESAEIRNLYVKILESKIDYDISNNRKFDEIFPELNSDLLLLFIRKDFNKGLSLLYEILNLKTEHQILLDFFKKISQYLELKYFIADSVKFNKLLELLLKIKHNDTDKKIEFKAIYAFSLGAVEASQKYLDKISSKTIKKNTLKLICEKAIEIQEYNFLITNFNLWVDDYQLLNRFLTICVENDLEENLSKLYLSMNKDIFLDKIIDILVEKKHDNEIHNLISKFPQKKDTINLLYNNHLENRTAVEIEKILSGDNYLKMLDLINSYPTKRTFIEFKVEELLRIKQKDNTDFTKTMSEDNIITLLVLFINNYNILKYLLLEKSKLELMLKENAEFINEAEKVFDLTIWKSKIN
jgi:hypothetical protein